LLRDLLTETLEKQMTILVIPKDVATCAAARRQVMQRAGKLQA